jgi:hypothetical protein
MARRDAAVSLALTPLSAQAATEPAIGIFWRVGNCLVIDRTTLPQAEPYGDCLTHASGHYERWSAWQALGATGLRAAGLPPEIGLREYDEWPRGRVVYEVPHRRFVLYADQRLQWPEILAQLRQAFGLANADVIVRGDPHYRR